MLKVISINGVEVSFPFDPYPQQKSVMNKVSLMQINFSLALLFNCVFHSTYHLVECI